jgi:hypothetical protein
MTIFQMCSDPDRYRSLEFHDPKEGVELVHLLKGESVKAKWRPPRVGWLDESDNLRLPEGNFPSLSGIMPVLDFVAMTQLSGILGDDVEYLPLECPDGEFSVLNVLRVIDILDESRSKLRRLSTGRVLTIDRHVFVEDASDRWVGSNIFKLPQLLMAQPYVTSELVTAAQHLRGFIFEKV